MDRTGRFGIAILKYIFNTGIITVPIFNYMLAFSTLILSMIVLNYLLESNNGNKVNSNIKVIAFNILFITSTQLPTWLTFTMYSFEVSVGYLLVAISIFYLLKSDKNRENYKLNLIKSILLLAFAISIYQSFITLYISIIIALLIIRSEKNDNTIILSSMISLILGCIIYICINKILSGNFIASEGGYISGFIGWETDNLITKISTIFIYIYSILNGEILYGGKVLGWAYSLSIYICVYAIFKRHSFKQVIYTACLLFSPFLLGMVLLSIQPIRSLVAIPFVCGVISYILIEIVFERSDIGIVGFIIIVILGINISVYTAKLNYGDFIRYNQDVSLANNIDYRINQLDLKENIDYPIVFVGHNSSNDDVYIIKSEVIGYSIFEWDMGNISRQISFMKTLGYSYNYPTAQEIELGYELSKDIEDFPNKNSVILSNDIIVVKLSDPHDYWKTRYLN